MQNYFCISSLQPAVAPKLPELQKPTNKQLCDDNGALHTRRSVLTATSFLTPSLHYVI